MDTPIAPIKEQIPGYVEMLGLSQEPEGLTATSGIEQTWAHILSMYASLDQACMIPVALATSQDRGRVQTPVAYTRAAGS